MGAFLPFPLLLKLNRNSCGKAHFIERSKMKVKTNNNCYEVYEVGFADYIVMINGKAIRVESELNCDAYLRDDDHLVAIAFAIFKAYTEEFYKFFKRIENMMFNFVYDYEKPEVLIDHLHEWFKEYERVYLEDYTEVFEIAFDELENAMYGGVENIESSLAYMKSLDDNEKSIEADMEAALAEEYGYDWEDEEESEEYKESFDDFGNENGRYGINYYYGDE